MLTQCLASPQGILLDEASGVNKHQQPVLPAGLQVPKTIVSSWNRKVSPALQAADSASIMGFTHMPHFTWHCCCEMLQVGAPRFHMVSQAHTAHLPLPMWHVNPHVTFQMCGPELFLPLEDKLEFCFLLHPVALSQTICMCSPQAGEYGKKAKSETFRLLHAKNILRPQLRFRERIDNSNTPFLPKIFVKPNARKPLPQGKWWLPSGGEFTPPFLSSEGPISSSFS